MPTGSIAKRPQAQVAADSGKVPRSVLRLCDLAYLERAVHRMFCGWGSQALDWADKVAVCRHVWDQAVIVQRLRERIDQFPGIHADAPVSPRLEKLANTVLLAPSFEDAVDGIHQLLSAALVNSYLDFIEQVDPIHDAPTHQIVQEIVTIKDLHRRWRSDYRRRSPHTIDPAYAGAIEAQLADVGHLREPLPATKADAAALAGVNTSFRPLSPRVHQSWLTTRDRNIVPYLAADFAESVEARRLFWPIGYMRELGLALDQLRWLYDSPYMPWTFHYDESRHMWDESRHGDSGHARMRDLGIAVEEVGFTHELDGDAAAKYLAEPAPTEPMSPGDLYEAMFFIGLVAETGHFRVKREAYADFRDGGDLASAEMMLYDIIDETTHVQYAHRWLPMLAGHAGIDHAGHEQRGVERRRACQAEEDRRVAEVRSRDYTRDPQYARYQELIQRLADQCPLSNARSCPRRSAKPM